MEKYDTIAMVPKVRLKFRTNSSDKTVLASHCKYLKNTVKNSVKLPMYIKEKTCKKTQ